jgi:hypothetical protein
LSFALPRASTDGTVLLKAGPRRQLQPKPKALLELPQRQRGGSSWAPAEYSAARRAQPWPRPGPAQGTGPAGAGARGRAHVIHAVLRRLLPPPRRRRLRRLRVTPPPPPSPQYDPLRKRGVNPETYYSCNLNRRYISYRFSILFERGPACGRPICARCIPI